MGTVVQTKLPPLSSFCWKAKKIPNASVDDAEITVYDEGINDINLRKPERR